MSIVTTTLCTAKVGRVSLATILTGWLAACTVAPGGVSGPETLPGEVYAAAEARLPINLREQVRGERLEPHWEEGAARFWYEADRADGYQYILVDSARKDSRSMFDREALTRNLSDALGEPLAVAALRLQSLEYDFAQDTLAFTFKERSWHYDPQANVLREVAVESPAGLSPDGRWRVFVKNYDLYIEEMASGDVRRLTQDGSALQPYARPVVNPKLMVEQQTSQPGLDAEISWSPDSERFVTYRTDLRGATQLSLVQSTPPDAGLPRVYNYVYSFSGDEIVPMSSALLVDAESGNITPVAAPAQEALYYFGPRFSWTSDSREVLQMVPQRGYTALRLRAIDANDGTTRPVSEDTSDLFVDYYGHRWSYLSKLDRVFWTSVQDGWQHAVLIDREGRRQNLTSGEWRIDNIAGVLEEEQVVFLIGRGREPGQDPYLRHLYRVDIDGGALQLLTPEALDHDVSVSPDGRYFVDNLSAVDRPTRSVLRSTKDGTIVMELEHADISALKEMGYRLPEPFSVKLNDGGETIHGAIYRPSQLDPSASYPVIEYIYTGPHTITTPKSFTAGLAVDNAAAIAELGFIVVVIDGRGTSGRSYDFLADAYKNLHAVGLDDHIDMIRAMARKYPYMDIDRVGLYGFSAGGYDVVRAMTERPDFYKVGVSASGNHDNRLDKAIWNEQWMGFPLDQSYEENSNVTWAGKLKGKLLLAHGELDENVPPLATRRLIAALIEANRDHDYMIIPNAGHLLFESPYFVRKRWDFFVRHLLGVEPPQDYAISSMDD